MKNSQQIVNGKKMCRFPNQKSFPYKKRDSLLVIYSYIFKFEVSWYHRKVFFFLEKIP